jgi:hypothetical protein
VIKEGDLLLSSGWTESIENRFYLRSGKRKPRQLQESPAAKELPFMISNRCGAWSAPACRSSLGREVFRSLATPRQWAPSVSAGAQQIKKTSNAPKPALKLQIGDSLRSQVTTRNADDQADFPVHSTDVRLRKIANAALFGRNARSSARRESPTPAPVLQANSKPKGPIFA